MKKLISLFLAISFVISAGFQAFAQSEDIDQRIRNLWIALGRYRTEESRTAFNHRAAELVQLYNKKGLLLTQQEQNRLVHDVELQNFITQQVLAKEERLSTREGLQSEISRLIELKEVYKDDNLRSAIIGLEIVGLNNRLALKN